jgi:glyoxylase-like metal-dependent hydrolase (beta-lactamase superfamily II)
MRRIVAVGILIAAGAWASGAGAWQQGGPANREVGVQKVRDNLYLLTGGGGNTAVFVTSTGVVVVDAKNPGWGQPILDKIKELTPKPVTTLINTHTHGDHVGGNAQFPASVDVVVQANTKANMDRMDAYKTPGAPGVADRTFTDRMTIGSGADAVELYYFGPGHTNGDTFVVFPALKAVHSGDLFAGKGLPLVDGGNGGSVLHYADTLKKAHAGIPGVETVIAGHSPQPLTWADLATFVEFNADFLAWAQAQLAAGKTPEQAAAEWTLPAKYASAGFSPNVPTLFGGLVGRLELLSKEMGARGPEPAR